eukprot:COSAG02_NODE_7070_length_3200_cov_2.047082_4_plen_123_part_00
MAIICFAACLQGSSLPHLLCAQVIFVGAAIISGSMLSCVIQKIEFPDQPTLLGDTLSAMLAFSVGAAALVGATQLLLENASDPSNDKLKVVGGTMVGSMLLTPVWFFSSGDYDKTGAGGQQL